MFKPNKAVGMGSLTIERWTRIGGSLTPHGAGFY
jgi:hypothetical protein